MCSERIDEICRMNLLPELAERYILSCRNALSEGKKKERFPNVAGFCRFCGIGLSSLSEIKSKYPDSYYALCSIFEDEAFNAELSPTVLTSYLKKRLDGEESASVCSELGAGELRLIFDHDVIADGE